MALRMGSVMFLPLSGKREAVEPGSHKGTPSLLFYQAVRRNMLSWWKLFLGLHSKL